VELDDTVFAFSILMYLWLYLKRSSSFCLIFRVAVMAYCPARGRERERHHLVIIIIIIIIIITPSYFVTSRIGSLHSTAQ
jgi:hypothetical protein